jgi:prepilin-type processing-associated H-X9-DG protein
MYMSAKNIDWYNNEGGSGTFTFVDGHLQIEGQTYYREEDSFEFEELDSEVVKNG